MRRPPPLSLALLFVASCSALVQIDDDKYLGGGASLGDGDGDGAGGGLGDGDANIGGSPGDGDGDGGGDGDGDTGGGGGGDGDGDEPSGGMGGAPVGGSGGGTGGGTGGDGAGGTPINIVVPIHYYPLDGNLDDFGSGDSLAAMVTSNVTLLPSGLAGGSVEIPASNDEYLSLDPAVGNTNPFTISWWFIPSKDGYITLAHRIPTQQSVDSWELILDTQSPRLKIGGTEYHFEYDFPSTSEGVWTHLVFGYHDMSSGTNDHFKVWVNGTLVLDRSLVLGTSAVVTGAGIVFGQSIGGTEPFWGYIDEIRVYDSLLTDIEVENLYLYDAP